MASAGGAGAGAGGHAGPRRAIATSGGSVAVSRISSQITAPLLPNAELLSRRAAIFDRLYAAQQARAALLERAPIDITLADGSRKAGVAHQTTPLEIAAAISKSLADSAVIAAVRYDDGAAAAKRADIVDVEDDDAAGGGCCAGGADATELWDLDRPLLASCTLELLRFDDPRAQTAFSHSAAHVLGEALERLFGAHLTVGPPLERGFYYDAYYAGRPVTEADYPAIEGAVAAVVRENQQFQRLEVSKEELLELFQDNPFKLALINAKIPAGGRSSCYRCGSLVDLCRGPHVRATGKIRAFMVEKSSAVYWLGDAKGDALQRVYGIAFPDAKLLKEYKAMAAEAKKRDHRLLGQKLSFFFFETNLSPGCCFWLPEGAKIYNKLAAFIRNEYRVRGFEEVITPNIFSCDLFKISGHLQNYKENMYCFDVENEEWAMKPMNCPGHCLMFRHIHPSYRQLPLRMADFGVLHRNEVSGSLSGLLRVRRFQQDDAHIFCRLDQVREEVVQALHFLFYVYGVFNFDFELTLSTRPKKAMGELAVWEKAEAALAQALDGCGRPWKLNPGDGAFYGPKIDVRVRDALQRWHQCGTVQLDFQLPLRFDLQYRGPDAPEAEAAAPAAAAAAPAAPTAAAPPTASPAAPAPAAADATASDGGGVGGVGSGSLESPLKPGHERPVIIHRAILGSLERVTAVLIEHTAAKFPYWLSPRQVMVVPVSQKQSRYGRYVCDILRRRGVDAAVDESSGTLNKKIRQAQLDQWNFLAVVGAREVETGSVTLRSREDPNAQQQLTLKQLLAHLAELKMPCSRPPEGPDDELPAFDPAAEAEADGGLADGGLAGAGDE